MTIHFIIRDLKPFSERRVATVSVRTCSLQAGSSLLSLLSLLSSDSSLLRGAGAGAHQSL